MAEVKILFEPVKRVVRQLEADRKETMSRVARLIREFHETLLIMAEDMTQNEASFYLNDKKSRLVYSKDSVGIMFCP